MEVGGLDEEEEGGGTGVGVGGEVLLVDELEGEEGGVGDGAGGDAAEEDELGERWRERRRRKGEDEEDTVEEVAEAGVAEDELENHTRWVDRHARPWTRNWEILGFQNPRILPPW